MLEKILNFYHNIPLFVDPTACVIGSFAVGWYPLMYLTAFGIAGELLRYRLKKENIDFFGNGFSEKTEEEKKVFFRDWIADLLFFALIGAIIGGRIGYVVFYNPFYYWNNPLEIVSPYDFSENRWVGIYGMSYHGGLLGSLVAAKTFSRKYKIEFRRLVNFIIPAVPAGYFFGRVGNFLNGELYGRVTKSNWGMYFFDSFKENSTLRFPSQLIEAFLEGLVLFVVLWTMRKKSFFSRNMLEWYLIGYGLMRIIGEFFREPDEHIGYLFFHTTLGQNLSIFMIMVGLGMLIFRKKKNEL